MENPYADTIDAVESVRNDANKAAEESEDVKSGKCTSEDEKKEPGYILYNSIVNSTINILRDPKVIEAFSVLSMPLGKDGTKALIEVLSVVMTTSAHNAILLYDDFLKQELTKQFDNVGNHLNLLKTDVGAYQGVLEVFKKRLGEIEEKMKLEELKNVVPK